MSSALDSAMHALDMPPPSRDSLRIADQFVTFACNGSQYGVDIMAVREIRSWQPTTVLPGRPDGACGVLDIRGSVVEVFDLSAVMGGRPLEPGPGNVVLVLAIEGRAVGILVDSVSDIIEAMSDQLMPVPDAGRGTGGVSHISSMVHHEDRLVAILTLHESFPG